MMQSIYSLLLLIPGLLGADPIARTTTGQIQGFWSTSTNGRTYATFSGIPYAKPPTQSLRFLRPEPAEPWAGVKQSTPGIKCIQLNIFKADSPLEGQEDCLIINVYTPKWSAGAPIRDPLPVMVFIHGGGYVSGSSSEELYGAAKFMDKDIVLVTLNYRVSVLGGLFLDGDVVTGNQQMWDQHLALKWIQNNIGYFGGNKDLVTIFGESAGAMSVMNHVLSPQSKGLFTAAIAQSGSPLSPFVGSDKHPAHYGHRLAERLGCIPSPSGETVLQCLQKVNPRDIQSVAYMFEESVRVPMPFKPIVDGDLVKDPFLPKEPIDILSEGTYNQVPLIIGSNKNEGLLVNAFFLKNTTKYDEAYDNWQKIGPLHFFHREQDEIMEEESEESMKYLRKHFKNSKFGPDSEEMIQMYGDLMFISPADMAARIISKTSSSPVYQYLYTHQGSFSLFDLMRLPPWKVAVKVVSSYLGYDLVPSNSGVCHADELFMLFEAKVLRTSTTVTEEDKDVSQRLLTMWTQFAKHHNPTPNEGTWTKLNSKLPRFLDIGSNESIMKYPGDYKERMQEWSDIWSKVPPLMSHRKSKTWNDQGFGYLPKTLPSSFEQKNNDEL